MKKALTVVLILALAICSVFAGDFKFLFTELDQHTEILAGFLPTLTAIGAGYEGLSLIEGDLTQFQATIGGGYTQRVLYQNPVTGEPLISDQMLFDHFADIFISQKLLPEKLIAFDSRTVNLLKAFCDQTKTPLIVEPTKLADNAFKDMLGFMGGMKF